MSKNRNRAKLKKAKCNKDYQIIYLNELYPLYWDDGIVLYPLNKKGYVNSNKRIPMYKVREYRTWKHNRKKQWK